MIEEEERKTLGALLNQATDSLNGKWLEPFIIQQAGVTGLGSDDVMLVSSLAMVMTGVTHVMAAANNMQKDAIELGQHVIRLVLQRVPKESRAVLEASLYGAPSILPPGKSVPPLQDVVGIQPPFPELETDRAEPTTEEEHNSALRIADAISVIKQSDDELGIELDADLERLESYAIVRLEQAIFDTHKQMHTFTYADCDYLNSILATAALTWAAVIHAGLDPDTDDIVAVAAEDLSDLRNVLNI